MADLCAFYRALTKMHSKLEDHNKGDTDYRKFYYLRKMNGDNCTYLGAVTKLLDSARFLQQFEPELLELIKQYKELKGG